MNELDSLTFAAMLRQGAVALGKEKKVINDLNVFPIPDGDTGDNMYMTMDSGAAELREPDSSLGAAAANAAKGMLLGARGNSGVILSRIFAGIAHGLRGVDRADLPTFSHAFSQGVEEAYPAARVKLRNVLKANADNFYREDVLYYTAMASELLLFVFHRGHDFLRADQVVDLDGEEPGQLFQRVNVGVPPAGLPF